MRIKGQYRYFVIIMVLVIMTMNYVDRAALAYAQKDVIGEFGFTTQEWGTIQGFFGFGYIFGGLVGGFLNDKLGPRTMWISAVTLWSVSIGLTAFAGDIGIAVFGSSAIVGFLIVRVLFGFAEGPSFVTMSRTVANWVGPKERTFASSVTLIGTPLGALIAAPLAGALIVFAGWRAMFIVLGVFGFVWVLVFRRVFTDQPEQNPKVSDAEIAEIRDGAASSADSELQNTARWYDFFRTPAYLLNTVGFFAISYIIFMLLTWTPKYLQDTYDVSLTSTSLLGMLPWIGPIFTTPLGGRIADLVARRTGSLATGRNSVAMVSLLLSGLAFVAIPATNSLAGALVLMSLGNSFALMSNSVYWSNLIDINSAKTGTFAGIMHFLGQSAAMIAPIATGFIVAGLGYNAAFVTAGIVCLIATVCVAFIRFAPTTAASANSTAPAKPAAQTDQCDAPSPRH